MIRLIAVISMILMPVVSVSTGTNDQESIVRSLDLVDEFGGNTGDGNPGSGGSAFGSSAFTNGSKANAGTE